MDGIIILEDMREMGTGYHLNFEEVFARQRWEEWYEGRYRTLYKNVPSISNGRKLLDTQDDLIEFSLFKIASDFYKSAVLAEEPASSASSATGTTWLEVNKGLILRALRRMAKYWSIHDYGVLLSEPGFIRTFDPTGYFRVGEVDQRDALVGHILVQLWRERDLEELNVHTTDSVPNRITVWKVSNGESTHQIFHYDGNIIGEPVTGLVPSPINGVCVAGSGDSWYPDVQHLAGRIMTNLSLIDDDQNRYRNQPRYMPAGVRASLDEAIRVAGGTPTPAKITEVINSLVRPIVTLDTLNEDVPNTFLDGDLQQDAAFEQLRTLLDLFFIGSGLPPSSYGIGVGRGESGYAREKAQDAATARARAFRQDLAECLPQMALGMGAPNGTVYTFNWSSPPFETRSATQQEILQLRAAGIISLEEAREALGWYGELPEELGSEDNDTQNEVTNND